MNRLKVNKTVECSCDFLCLLSGKSLPARMRGSITWASTLPGLLLKSSIISDFSPEQGILLKNRESASKGQPEGKIALIEAYLKGRWCVCSIRFLFPIDRVLTGGGLYGRPVFRGGGLR